MKILSVEMADVACMDVGVARQVAVPERAHAKVASEVGDCKT